MVTLYNEVAYRLDADFIEFFNDKEGQTLESIKSSDLAYRSYQRWNENGGQERYLPGFKLTNLQMFWLCMAHYNTFKYNVNNPDGFEREDIDYESDPLFREAYKCGEN